MMQIVPTEIILLCASISFHKNFSVQMWIALRIHYPEELSRILSGMSYLYAAVIL